MAQDYRIGALWIGGSLSFIEQLCLVSFRDVGQHVTLYTYGEVQNVPEGIEIADGNEVLAMDEALVHKRTGSPALQSDKFRYHLLAKNDHMIWADTDAYCVKPFTTPNGHFYAWESDHLVNGGVLGLPRDSETLRELIEFTSDENAIPEWLPQAQKDEMQAARDAGTPVHAGEQVWGVWGPKAITYYLHKTGEIRFAMPRAALYPIPFKNRRIMVRPHGDAERFLTADTYSIHFYGRRMRKRIAMVDAGVPDPDSMIGQLLEKHGIKPSDAPLPPAPPRLEPLKPEDRHGRGQLNLTDLADARQIDRGSARHKYTELYNLLFQPLRQRKLKIVLVGLDGGAGTEDPSLWAGAAKPMLEMWLEYFPKAEFIALDRAKAPPFKDKRVSYTQVSLEDPDEIEAAVTAAPDIVIDDATHASHHQQNALRALFPKLRSGGIYAIEDLRSTPNAIEKQGFVKSAALFQGYVEHGIFEHPDEDVKDDMNALRADFSGCFLFPAGFVNGRRAQMLVLHKR